MVVCLALVLTLRLCCESGEIFACVLAESGPF